MVSFPQAIVLGFRNYFNFTGFATRSEYWWFFAFLFIMNFIAGVLDYSLDATLRTNAQPFGIALAVLLLIPAVSVYIRRLRDGGHSALNIAWFLGLFLAVFIPLINIVYPLIVLGVWLYQMTRPTQHFSTSTYGYNQ